MILEKESVVLEVTAELEEDSYHMLCCKVSENPEEYSQHIALCGKDVTNEEFVDTDEVPACKRCEIQNQYECDQVCPLILFSL